VKGAKREEWERRIRRNDKLMMRGRGVRRKRSVEAQWFTFLAWSRRQPKSLHDPLPIS
jgi:hypothetical protein